MGRIPKPLGPGKINDKTHGGINNGILGEIIGEILEVAEEVFDGIL